MSSRLIPIAMVMAVAGCAPPGFSRLGPFHVAIGGGGELGMMAFLVYVDQKVGCQTLDEDFTATADGVEVETFRGERSLRSSFQSLGTWQCIPPRVDFAPPPFAGRSVTLEMRSGGDQVVATVEGLGQALTGVLIAAPGTQVHVGDRIQIALGQGFDQLTWPPAFSDVFEDSSRTTELIDVAPPSADGVLDIQLPASLPPGRTHLQMVLNSPPTFSRCEGADGCEWLAPVPMTVSLKVAFDVWP